VILESWKMQFAGAQNQSLAASVLEGIIEGYAQLGTPFQRFTPNSRAILRHDAPEALNRVI